MVSAQWISQTPSNIPTNTSISSVHIISPTNAYLASGNGLFKTTDGGVTWLSNFLPSTNFASVQFVNTDTGYTVASRIYKTTDGGSNWNIMPDIPGALFTPNENLQFTNANTGFVNASHGSVFRTVDGGNSWNQIKNAAGLGSVLGMCFVNNTTGYTVGYAISKTTNSGMTWSMQTSPTTSLLNDVYFVNANEGWAVGDDGTIITTADGGTTWSLQTSSVTNQLTSVHFTNNLEGIAVGKSGIILKTKDGGTTWYTQMSNTTENLNDIHFLDPNIGLAIGANRTILKTTTGGDFASALNSLKKEDVMKLQLFPNPVTNTVNVKAEEKINSVSIYNMAGNIISQQKTSSKNVTINTEAIATGNYRMMINYENGHSTKGFSVRKK